MARTIGLITELEVINSVLSTVGDNPVQSLDDGYQPVFIIKSMLNNLSRDMQTKKYWFNTEYDVVLTPNTLTDKIILPFNILHFEPLDTEYVARGLTVYDRVGRTSTITSDITADICLMLEFEELPQVARKYIQAQCKAQYNDEYLGEESLKGTLAQEINMAKIELDRAHMENEDINMLNSARANSVAFKNRRRS